MSTSILNYILVYAILLLANFIGFLDYVLRVSFVTLRHYVTVVFLCVVYTYYMYFMVVAARTGFLREVLEGYFIVPNTPEVSLVTKNLYPRLSQFYYFPEITAKQGLIYDVNSGKQLYEKDASDKVAPASTTKLMSALVALEIYTPSDVLIVPEDCTTEEVGSKINLLPGYKYNAYELIKAMLISSAGDATCVIASSKYPARDFVDRMNRRAKELKMDSSHFNNPIGLDSDYGDHYSTAEDLLKLSLAATKKDLIKTSVALNTYTLKSQGTILAEHYLVNTNKLLSTQEGSVGIKTGTTPGAGEVLIYEYSLDNKDLIFIVMGSTNRFSDTQALLKWVFTAYTWPTELD